jgi:hypothetical protein
VCVVGDCVCNLDDLFSLYGDISVIRGVCVWFGSNHFDFFVFLIAMHLTWNCHSSFLFFFVFMEKFGFICFLFFGCGPMWHTCSIFMDTMNHSWGR